MTSDTPQALHATFCKETGRDSNFQVWSRAYMDYFAKGYTVADLELVLRYLKRENVRMNGAAFSLRQSKIFDFEYMHFDALLNEARVKERNRRPSPSAKEQALETLRPTVDGESAHPRANGEGLHIKTIFRNLGQ